MNKIFGRVLWTLMALPIVVAVGGYRSVTAQSGNVFAYPLKGQDAEQQKRDQFECHQWAVRQTGFDPATAQPISTSTRADVPASSSSGGTGFLGIGGDRNVVGGQGSTLSDAGTGAALGAIGGAIAGSPGAGAAIGAGVSALFGGISRSSRRNQEEQYRQQQEAQMRQQQQQAQQQRQQQIGDFNRAYGTCMSGRGYRVS